MAEYLLRDRDKAAFTSKMNKVLNQVKPGLELSMEDFIDIPDMGGDDMSIFVTEEPIQEKMLDMLIAKKNFSYKIKKVNLKSIVDSIK